MTDAHPKRCVYHLGGFDPLSPETVYRRFQREMTRFETTWSVKDRNQPAGNH